jgi:hypothetical protein
MRPSGVESAARRAGFLPWRVVRSSRSAGDRLRAWEWVWRECVMASMSRLSRDVQRRYSVALLAPACSATASMVKPGRPCSTSSSSAAYSTVASPVSRRPRIDKRNGGDPHANKGQAIARPAWVPVFNPVAQRLLAAGVPVGPNALITASHSTSTAHLTGRGQKPGSSIFTSPKLSSRRSRYRRQSRFRSEPKQHDRHRLL